MRVLVCGGRDYTDTARVFAVLDKLQAGRPLDVVIEGGAKGADACAKEWAFRRSVSVETYEAEWDVHGTFAGPVRNKRMLQEGRPDLVIAFPGGKGTRSMVGLARKFGVEVIEIAP